MLSQDSRVLFYHRISEGQTQRVVELLIGCLALVMDYSTYVPRSHLEESNECLAARLLHIAT